MLIIWVIWSLGQRAEAQTVVLDSSRYPRPVVLTAQQDQDNMLKQLGIKRLRSGPSGDAAAPTTKAGKKATTPAMRWQRRPEIVQDFEREVYGRIPQNTPKVTWTVKVTNREFVGRT